MNVYRGLKDGFTLVEVLIAGALLSILSLALTGMFKNQVQSFKKVEARYDVLPILLEISGDLKDPESCIETIKPFLDGGKIEKLWGKDKDGNLVEKFIIEAGKKYGTTDLKIVKYAILMKDLSSKELMLAVHFLRGKDLFAKKVIINVNSTVIADVDECSASSAGGGTESAFLNMGEPGLDQLYFDEELSIGIGTENPLYKLHVVGDVKADSFKTDGGVISNEGISASIMNVSETLNVGTIISTGNITASSGTFGTLSTSTLNVSSDIRLKQRVRSLINSYDKIIQLDGVSYILKLTGERSIGLIAQDVEKIYPELVATSIDGFKSINYTGNS